MMEKEELEEIHALIAEGYQKMSEENLSLADEAWPLAVDMMRRYTVWV